METLFENEDFILKSTGHNYDFVGIIETKTDEPLTFFFEEHAYQENIEENDDFEEVEINVDENETKLLDVYQGLKTYDNVSDDEEDEEEETAISLGADSYFRTRDDKNTGFLSDCRERGQFLALVKHYCPEKLDRIGWA